jgi:hypothetical protein
MKYQESLPNEVRFKTKEKVPHYGFNENDINKH